MTAPEVVIAPDALAQAAEYAARQRWPRALLVMDTNTRQAAGERLASELRSARVPHEEFVFEEREGLLADPAEADRVRARLSPEAVPVAVGSGVITDIVRWAAHGCDVDFVSVATAASMDGYASSVAAMQIDGVKVTYSARAPVAIFADPRIAAQAPSELNRAGLGDLLGKATARIDWLASHLLCGEPLDAEALEQVQAPLRDATQASGAILRGEPDAITSLLHGLIQSGLAMTRVGNSRPASGCEHHASHFWDLQAAHGRRAHHSHGLQVGYATRFAVRLARFAFGGGIDALRPPRPPPSALDEAAQRWLGAPTAELAAAVREKRAFVLGAAARWDRLDWAQVRAALVRSLQALAGVDRALEQAGFPLSPGFLEVDAEMLRATFPHATRLRARYTTVDLLEGQGRLDDAIDTLFV